MTFHIKRSLVEEMIAHSKLTFPIEACGIIAALDGRPVKLYPTRNCENSPVLYEMHAEEVYRVWKDIDARGWRILGYFHSHTGSPAYPSRTDVEKAYDSGAIYVIVSLMHDEAIVRAYRIVDGCVEQELIVEELD